MREITGEVKGPKPDPEVVRQVFQAVTNVRFYPVTDAELLEKPNTVLIAGNGLFMHRNLPYADMTFKLAESSQFEGILPKLGVTVDVHTPKLPWLTLLQVIAFFRDVTEKHKAEAYVQILYCPSEDRWEVFVPEQEVTGGHVDHLAVRGDRLIDGVTWLHVWDIHSHNVMAPFFSTGDDKDEGRSHRFYGVIGHLDNALPKMKIRISDGLGRFLEPPMSALIEMPEEQVLKVNSLSLLTDSPEVTLPLDGVMVPEAWMNQLMEPRPLIAASTTVWDGIEDGWDAHGGYAGPQNYRSSTYNPTYNGYRGGYPAGPQDGHGYFVNDKRRYAGLNPEFDRKPSEKKGD